MMSEHGARTLEAVRLIEKLRRLGACQSGCNGRCQECPDDVASQAADMIAALAAAGDRTAVPYDALEAIERGEYSDLPSLDDSRRNPRPVSPGKVEGCEADTVCLIDDKRTGVFGEKLYRAIVQTTEMRPQRIARLLGTFKSRAEAEAALPSPPISSRA